MKGNKIIDINGFFCFYRWKFAYNVIVNEEVRPRLAYYKWENIKMNLVRCREYHTLHLKELSNQITKEEKQRAKVR